MRTLKALTIGLISTLLLSACATLGPNGNAGLGIGAAGGCIAGTLLAHNGAGCATGAILGGGVGAAIGTANDQANGYIPPAFAAPDARPYAAPYDPSFSSSPQPEYVPVEPYAPGYGVSPYYEPRHCFRAVDQFGRRVRVCQ